MFNAMWLNLLCHGWLGAKKGCRGNRRSLLETSVMIQDLQLHPYISCSCEYAFVTVISVLTG